MLKGERTRRVARLVSILCANKKGCTIGQMVRATGSSRATAYRDLALLRGSGYSLNITTVNGEARYALSASALSTEPMTPRELATLALARKALSAVEGTWPVRELDTILDRGRAVPKEDDGVWWKLAPLSYDPSLLASIHQAVTDQRMLRIRYRGANDETPQSRTVHPYRLQVVDQQPYLVAWDEQKKAMRTFKVARTTHSQLLRTRCRIPDAAIKQGSAEAKSVKLWQNAPIDVRIRIAAPVVRFVAEWPLVPSQQIENAPRGAADVCARVFGIEETLRWVLRWGKHACVIEPATLRQRVTDELRGALEAYEIEPSHDRETPGLRRR